MQLDSALQFFWSRITKVVINSSSTFLQNLSQMQVCIYPLRANVVAEVGNG